jgi:hypothetical protein
VPPSLGRIGPGEEAISCIFAANDEILTAACLFLVGYREGDKMNISGALIWFALRLPQPWSCLFCGLQ